MKFKVGDKVRVIGRGCGQAHPCRDHPNGLDGCIGDVGKIITTCNRRNPDRCIDVDFNDSLNGARHFCGFRPSELEFTFNKKELI